MIIPARLLALREQAIVFWTHGLWQHEQLESRWGRRLFLLTARALYIVASGFRKERIKLRAAALTYVTLLSLVPAVVVVFSIFTAFGGLDDTKGRLKEIVIDALAVTQREAAAEFFDRFISQTSAGQLGSIGVATLLLTTISLLTNIEKAFNDIWGLTRDRTVLQRFQVYWPLITLGPILLGVSLSTTAAVEASDTVQALRETVPGFRVLTGFGPLLLTATFFVLAYQVVPNTKVKLRYAAVGGFVAGTLWVIAQKLYAVYAANAITYSAIYGSLAAVPLFILWVYVSWMVTLLGATLTFAVQNARTYEPERSISEVERELVAVRLVLAVVDRYQKGSGTSPVSWLLDEVSVPPRLARKLLGDLANVGLLLETYDAEPGYVPGRPAEQLSLADVVQALRHLGSQPASPDDTLGQIGASELARLDASIRAELSTPMTNLLRKT